jgi:hypothetical protein
MGLDRWQIVKYFTLSNNTVVSLSWSAVSFVPSKRLHSDSGMVLSCPDDGRQMGNGWVIWFRMIVHSNLLVLISLNDH